MIDDHCSMCTGNCRQGRACPHNPDVEDKRAQQMLVAAIVCVVLLTLALIAAVAS